jgi:lipopolysaccharide export system permease protein
MIKTYQKYIIKNYLKSVFSITGIFFCLVLVLNIFEEINYFKDIEITFLFPLFLNFLNAPSILYNIFPFIFLISSQFFLLNLIEKNELIVLKNFGIDNFKLIKILTTSSFVLGLLVIIIFYNLSSNLKYIYLDLKSDYSSDDKYLAVITENGLWIRDEVDNQINIINADKIEKNILKVVTITKFDSNFNLLGYIYTDEVNIEKNEWFIKKATINDNMGINIMKKNFFFQSNFNSEKINTLFSNLESLSLWELLKLKRDYKDVGYSISEIDIHLQRIYSYPIYLVIMTVLSAVMMLKIGYNKPRIFYLILGILLSVIIFYLNRFVNLLGENEKLPIHLSIWLPHILMFILITIGLVRINEK